MTAQSGAVATLPADWGGTAGRICWRRSIGWLLLLGPFFFLSYGYANAVAADREIGTAVVFAWERQLPFWAWTIVPYWSIDLLYGLSFLYCRDRFTVDRHALRLLSVQVLSVACFLAFPLRFSFARPDTDGLFGLLFDVLMDFDQPYNQAPSLHIGLLVVIWIRFALGTQGLARLVVHGWAALIALSVLTTYQHHFIDVPTGALAGLLCVWLWPDRGASPLAGWRWTRDSTRRRLGAIYLGAASLLGAIALLGGGAALWLLWPAVALLLVALIHLGPGARGFQKHDGRPGVAARCLLAPYMLGAWLNSRWWTRGRRRADRVAGEVWLGRMPSAADLRAGRFGSLVDLTAELPAPRGNWRYVGLPWLDLVAPDARALLAVARHIETLSAEGPVLVCCALGFSRSACAVAAWLLLSARADGVDDAVAQVERARPGVVLGAAHRRALAACLVLIGAEEQP
ncbi:phosphatase PAP2/dual specificity phosphatase family protein [Thauera sp. CAU 1555]|uniref:Phosphatase PAP2/dual specificity phosphatase family protein n=1 Tax=Thauera sedimentorum TaxID=2767595 RepID=A0ABR9BA29_9RHOO|nr:phosphatase PAP2/dual specificity phosphatase family protein [Thauera sedimentorum]MBC9071964.1 phosphatase PAP2/dual specificity phosphatase family protein [Thauera sedimentorum]MBD8502883.1 phosphatase PAP2/dual specificity phosphatase family protein [Thauera sedimentorum]